MVTGLAQIFQEKLGKEHMISQDWRGTRHHGELQVRFLYLARSLRLRGSDAVGHYQPYNDTYPYTRALTVISRHKCVSEGRGLWSQNNWTYALQGTVTAGRRRYKTDL